jgi:predicted helicase
MKQTGSYYTPPEVVGAMVELVDEILRTSRFGLHAGLASPSVTLADPATGTGTFMLGVLRRIAETVRADEGEGAVKGSINAAVQRLVAFEMQLGPFAVAQLRILAEIVDLTGAPPNTHPGCPLPTHWEIRTTMRDGFQEYWPRLPDLAKKRTRSKEKCQLPL